MSNESPEDLSWDAFDEQRDPRPHDHDFDRVVDRALSRRGFLGSVLAFGSGAVAFGSGLLDSGSALAHKHTNFAFEPIDIATDFDIHVPAGYRWKTLVRWGDPLFSSAQNAYSAENGVSLDMSDQVFGENTDGMESFVIEGKQIIAVNSEYANPKINLPTVAQGTPRNSDDVKLIKNLQGRHSHGSRRQGQWIWGCTG